TAYANNCKKPDDDDFAARKLCLEGQSDSVSLLVDPKAAKSLTGAELGVMLPDPGGCVRAPRVIGPPLPKDPALRAREQELRMFMIVLRGRVMAGDDVDPDVLAKARAAAESVEHSENPSVRADAIGVLAMIAAADARTNRDPDAMSKVLALMKQASEVAEAAGQDRTRVQLQLGMLEMTVFMPGYWSELDDLVQRGESGVEHTKDPIAELAFAGAKTEIADKRGRWSEAIDGYDEVRKQWLARGAVDIYARFTIAYASALLNRHVPGDVDRALASLDEAATKDLGTNTMRSVKFLRDAVAEAVGKADDAAFQKLGYTRDAGAPDGGTLVATVSGLELPTPDDRTPPAARHAIPEVRVTHNGQTWRVAIGADGVFTLANVPPGVASVEAFVNSAAGDLQMIRRDATITAHQTTKVDLPYGHAGTLTTNFPGGGEPRPHWGIAIALPKGKPPANGVELQERIAKTPWWSVTTVHTTKKNGAIQLEATLGTFGEAVVCPIPGGFNNGSDPSLFLGTTNTPLQCQ
ncbi:MAG: hypothetical protein JO257_28085, partial [Deltaproteobacteria bacterium]|nr:hypothetical protein [Deltaproteobacteria bacterium]